MEIETAARIICVIVRQQRRGLIGTRSRGAAPDTDAVPLWVGLVVFVSLMFNHSVAADAYVWPGHLHPVQRDPETHRKTRALR